MSIIQPRGRFGGHEVIDESRKHLEPEELIRFFEVLKDSKRRDYFGPFWYAYFRIQYYFGCRVSEVAIILKEDISFEEKMIIIRRLKKRRFKKDGDQKEVVGPGYTENVYGLPEPLLRMAKKVEEETAAKGVPEENPWLFASKITGRVPKGKSDRMAEIRRVPCPGGGFWRAVSRDNADEHFRTAAKEAKIPDRLCHSHVLRHTRATLMLAEGAPEEDVRFILGHSSIDTTRRYLGLAKTLRLRRQHSAELALGDLDDI
jgi:integrase